MNTRSVCWYRRREIYWEDTGYHGKCVWSWAACPAKEICKERMQQGDGEIQKLYQINNLFIPVSERGLGNQPPFIIEFSGYVQILRSETHSFPLHLHRIYVTRYQWSRGVTLQSTSTLSDKWPHTTAQHCVSTSAILMHIECWIFLLRGTSMKMLHTFSHDGIPHTQKNICPNGSGFLGSYIFLKISMNYASQVQSSLCKKDSGY